MTLLAAIRDSMAPSVRDTGRSGTSACRRSRTRCIAIAERGSRIVLPGRYGALDAGSAITRGTGGIGYVKRSERSALLGHAQPVLDAKPVAERGAGVPAVPDRTGTITGCGYRTVSKL